MTEVARLLLAAVFAVAGAAKLYDREGSRSALRGFGAPERAVAPLAIGLPLAELAVAAALVPTASAQAAAAVATTLLGGFILVIALALARGRKPDCHCFGRLHSAPAGPGALARTAALALAALFVATQPTTTPSPLTLAALGGTTALGVQAYAWFELLRRYGRALRRIDELEPGIDGPDLEIGSQAPAFALPSADGAEVRLADLLAPERPLLLVFTDTGCGACTALLPDLGRWQAEKADRVAVAVVGHGDPEQLRAAGKEHGIVLLLLAPDRTVSQAYGAYGTPSAIFVAADGRIASPVLYGADDIEALLGPALPRVEIEAVARV